MSNHREVRISIAMSREIALGRSSLPSTKRPHPRSISYTDFIQVIRTSQIADVVIDETGCDGMAARAVHNDAAVDWEIKQLAVDAHTRRSNILRDRRSILGTLARRLIEQRGRRRR